MPFFSPLHLNTSLPLTVSPVVGEAQTLGIAAAWRATNMIVNGIATMPIHAYRSSKRLGTTPSLLERPNSSETRVETISKLIYSLVLRGNAYALLGDFDYLQRPRQLEVVNPGLVSVTQDVETGRLVYNIGNESYAPSSVLHIRGLCPPGSLTGLGVVDAQRQSLAHVLAQNEYGYRQWTESSVPPVNITVDVDGEFTQAEARAVQDAWVAAHGTGRKPSVVPQNMTVTPFTTFSPEDAQYLQSREFSLNEIALMFGIPGYRLGAPGSSTTYQNAAQDDLFFLKSTLMPWMIRIEAALTDLMAPGIEARFNPDALLRADTKTRYEAHEIAIRAGVLEVNEARELENLEPLGTEITQEQVNLLTALVNAGFDPPATLKALAMPNIKYVKKEPALPPALPTTQEEPQEDSNDRPTN